MTPTIDFYAIEVMCPRHGAVGVGQAIECDIWPNGTTEPVRLRSGRFAIKVGSAVLATESGPVLNPGAYHFYSVPLLMPMPDCPIGNCDRDLRLDYVLQMEWPTSSKKEARDAGL